MVFSCKKMEKSFDQLLSYRLKKKNVMSHELNFEGK